MSWFRLEGRGAFHHKVLAAGNEAYGAWCRAGQWSSDQLTDGAVPRAVAEQIAKPKVWLRLVEVRLAHEVEGGYQIHDFLDFNPSSEQERAKREEMREKRREAGRVGGKRSGEVRRGEGDSNQKPTPGEPTTKQSASTGASSGTKQNEPPNPNPNPLLPTEEDPPNPPQAGGSGSVGAPPPEPVKRKRRAPQVALPGIGGDAADDVFAAYLIAWRREIGKGTAPVLDAKRRRLVHARLAEGHTIERLKAAAGGIFDSDWHRDESRIGFELALRDAGQIEKFGALFDAAEEQRRPPQPSPSWLNQLPPRPRGYRQSVLAANEELAKVGGTADPFAGVEECMAVAPDAEAP